MAENKLSMFGKVFNTVGSTDSNFVIKTKGDLKIQWGNKFIDLIKNGKIVQTESNILKSVNNESEITGNGIYIVKGEQEKVWVSIGGSKINLTNNGTSYVSFVEEQESTEEQKTTALKNIGFYYDSIEDIKNSQLTKGIVYNLGDNKLYAINNSQVQEYQINNTEISSTELEKLIVKDLTLYKDEEGNMVMSSPSLKILINQKEVINLSSDAYLNIPVILGEDSYLQSEDQKFKLYKRNNKYILEVDSIVWRDSEKELPNSVPKIQKFDTYIDNYATFTTQEEIEVQSDSRVMCEMQFPIKYQIGDYIYIFIKDNPTLYVERVNTEQNKVQINAILSRPIDIDAIITVRYQVNNAIYESDITIKQGETSGNVLLSYTNIIITEYSIKQGQEEIDNDIFDQYLIPIECKIINIDNNIVTLSIDSSSYSSFTSNCINSPVCKSRVPIIQQNINIDLLDRSHTIIQEEEEKVDDTIHTRLGDLSTLDLSILDNYSNEEETEKYNPKVGIYSDYFIGLNSKLYDSVFKKRCDYPKYDKSVEIPEDFQDEKYNKAVPNVEWIKELIKLAVPSGTIAMYNGQSEIPEGWAVCDGNNGTPNLVGKFIKAVATKEEIGENNILNKNNEFTLTQEYLPKHSHPHNPHTHTFNLDNTSINIEESGDLNLAIQQPINVYNTEEKNLIQSISDESIVTEPGTVNNIISSEEYKLTITGGNHSHNATLSTTDNLETQESTSGEVPLEDLEWQNKPIKIEPNSYSLIFIMKL